MLRVTIRLDILYIFTALQSDELQPISVPFYFILLPLFCAVLLVFLAVCRSSTTRLLELFFPKDKRNEINTDDTQTQKKKLRKKIKGEKTRYKKTFDKMKRLHCTNKRIVKNVSA